MDTYFTLNYNINVLNWYSIKQKYTLTINVPLICSILIEIYLAKSLIGGVL